MKYQISEGTYRTYGLKQKDPVVRIVQRLSLSENCQKRVLCADNRPPGDYQRIVPVVSAHSTRLSAAEVRHHRDT